MTTAAEAEKLNLQNFEDAISKTNDTNIDTLWAILKYKEIGIYRKVKCMSEVLGVDFDQPQESYLLIQVVGFSIKNQGMAFTTFLSSIRNR